MRVSIELKVIGSTLEEIIDSAVDAWNEFSGESVDVLPPGSEIDVVAETAGSPASYIAKVFVRKKIDDTER